MYVDGSDMFCNILKNSLTCLHLAKSFSNADAGINCAFVTVVTYIPEDTRGLLVCLPVSHVTFTDSFPLYLAGLCTRI